MSVLEGERSTTIDSPTIVHSVHVLHPFDLELDGAPDALDLYAEEVDEIAVGPTDSCSQTLSTLTCDCATTLSTLYCYSCDIAVTGD